MAKKKRHHYIPKFYLDGFVDPNNKPYIWVYEKGNPNVIKAKAENIAFQKHYYSFTTPEGSKDSETFENALARIEGQVAPVFQKIKNHESLDGQERVLFATFLALIMVRVPNFRGNIERATAQSWKKFSRFWASDTEKFKSSMGKFEKDTGNKVDVPIEKLQKYIGQCEIKVNPQFSLSMIRPLVKDFAPILYGMKWSFFIAKGDHKFVTSDNPLFYNDPSRDPQSFHGVGLPNRDIELTFPISKDLALFGTWKPWENIKEDYIIADNHLVEEINRRTIISASRFVFSSQMSDGLNRLVQKYKDCSGLWIKVS